MRSGIASLLGTWSGALTALLVCLIVYGFHPIKRWRYRHIPGPPPTWLVGNLLPLVKKGFPSAVQDWAKEYGGVFKVWQGGTILIVVEDPVSVRTVNMRNHERPPILTSLAGKEKEFDQAGLLLSDGKYWQSLRQAWQSMFHANSLRQYTDLMNASAQRLVDVLAAKAQTGEPVEMWRLFGCLTMEVVGSTAFGVELRMLDDTSKALPTATKDIDFNEADSDGTTLTKAAAILFGFAGPTASPYVALRLLCPEGVPLWSRLATYCPDKSLRRVLKARRKMRAICFSLIADSKQREVSTAAYTGCSSDGSEGKPASGGTAAAGPEREQQPQPKHRGALPPGGFISHLLAAENKLIGRKFTDLEVAAQAFTFLLAGYETTASALAFAVYHIARTPAAEERLLTEIDAFGRAAVPTFDDLERFPYLDAVFSEALRLSPPAAFGTIRIAREDFQLAGHTIRKGWYLNTAQYSFQRNEKYWPDAEKFLPERFLTDKGTGMPAWAPFGDGGRSCVGVRFARAEAKIALIRLYQNFTLRLLPGQEPLETVTTITMSPKFGIKVSVHPR